MTKKRGKTGGKRNPSLTAFAEIEDAGDKAFGAAERLTRRIIDLEAMADFYAWGPSPKGELEPMHGEEYAKAMAKDGGKIARAYLKGRFDRCYYGEPNKDAPGGWGRVGRTKKKKA
jgi:hypothetical protein